MIKYLQLMAALILLFNTVFGGSMKHLLLTAYVLPAQALCCAACGVDPARADADLLITTPYRDKSDLS